LIDSSCSAPDENEDKKGKKMAAPSEASAAPSSKKQTSSSFSSLNPQLPPPQSASSSSSSKRDADDMDSEEYTEQKDAKRMKDGHCPCSGCKSNPLEYVLFILIIAYQFQPMLQQRHLWIA
jgi:hypothetical protein